MFHSAFRSNRDKIEASTNSELQRHRLEFGIFPQEAPKKELPKLGDTLDAIRVSTVIVDCMGLHCSTRDVKNHLSMEHLHSLHLRQVSA